MMTCVHSDAPPSAATLVEAAEGAAESSQQEIACAQLAAPAGGPTIPTQRDEDCVQQLQVSIAEAAGNVRAARARAWLKRQTSSGESIIMEHRRSAGFKGRRSREEMVAKEEDFSSAADAFSSIAIISMLVFGFAVSSFGGLAGLPIEFNERLTVSVFACSVALTAVLSGYATIFMTLTYYYLKRLDAKDARLRLFYERTAFGRWAARQATWASLVLYLSSLAVLGFEMLSLAAAIVCASLVGVGALIMMITTTSLHHLATDEPAPPLSLAELANSSGSEMTRSTTLTRGSGRGFPGVLSRGPSAARLSRVNSQLSQSSLNVVSAQESSTPQESPSTSRKARKAEGGVSGI